MPGKTHVEDPDDFLTASLGKTQEVTMSEDYGVGGNASPHTASTLQAERPLGACDRFVPLRTDEISVSDLPQDHGSSMEMLPVEIP